LSTLWEFYCSVIFYLYLIQQQQCTGKTGKDGRHAKQTEHTTTEGQTLLLLLYK